MALAHSEIAGVPVPRHAPRIRAAEWRWVAIVTGVLLLLTIPPILIAAARVPAGHLFAGYVVIARDAYVYQGLWHAGASGEWLFRSHYTGEALPSVLLYPWYLWTGRVIGQLPPAWLYHGTRLVAGGALLILVYALAGELFRPVVLRRWAFILAALGGGIGLLVPSISAGPLTIRATEIASPGSSVADLVAMAPHLPLALALMCAIFLSALKMRRGWSWPLIVGIVSGVIGLQLIYPQLALLAALVVGGWAAARRLPVPLVVAAAALVVQAPYDLYLLDLMRHQPLALAAVRTTLEVGDPIGFLLLSHLAATSLIVVALVTRRLRGDLILPALWIVGMTAFMFTPVISGALGRSFMASSIPFGLCAVPGLLGVLRGLRARRWRRRALTVALVLASFYGIFGLAQPLWIATLRLDPLAEYESRDEARLLDRLGPRVSSSDLLLTTYLEGLFVPAQTGARVYAGHPDMTIDAAVKATRAYDFFNRWGAGQRDVFLQSTGVDYVLTTDPAVARRLQADPLLRSVDREGGAALFEVRH